MTTSEHNDVVSGKGCAIQKCPGNKHSYHWLIEAVKPTYDRVPKHQRCVQAEFVVDQIHKLEPPGRFLQKNVDRTCEELDTGTNVKKKAWQALRDALEATKASEGICISNNN